MSHPYQTELLYRFLSNSHLLRTDYWHVRKTQQEFIADSAKKHWLKMEVKIPLYILARQYFPY